MVSVKVLTAEPVEATPWPETAIDVGRLVAHRRDAK